MLGTEKKKRYLNIKDGRIVTRGDDGNELFYDFVEGYLTPPIITRDRDFKGETVKYWNIPLTDRKGEEYILALPYSSGTAKSIINSLANVPDLTREIRIKPYLSGEFTKITLYCEGSKIAWKHSELPPLEEVKVGDRIVKDDSKRMEFFRTLVDEINNHFIG